MLAQHGSLSPEALARCVRAVQWGDAARAGHAAELQRLCAAVRGEGAAAKAALAAVAAAELLSEE